MSDSILFLKRKCIISIILEHFVKTMNDDLFADGNYTFPWDDAEIHCLQYNLRWSYFYISYLTRNIVFTDWTSTQVPRDLYEIIHRYNDNRHWWDALCLNTPLLLSYMAVDENMLRDI